MSNIEVIVDALENKISKVLHQQRVLKQTNVALLEELQQSKSTIQDQDLAIATWKEKYESLKMANSILGSDNDKRETKLKINALIRDIDHCIGQLSE
ncbi:hypothetical protein N7U66_04500 [Lacinutrix neustonica]|uniref:Uncharacterized protein n=1 Tax=Lacinutrix neustonica TaxID=2980107 RepID=A0A9E8MWH8_9FLAO|nr:hypothetical protein [Lacinutrix neustonica]WAC02893.1 hypothetical protein N7U66_04500 [Lacinutrix neustonica]